MFELVYNARLDTHGYIQDKKDSSVQYPTSNAIFILTSNCFAEEISWFFKHYSNWKTVYDEFNKRVFTNSSLRCGDSGHPFAKPEFIRRLRSGHALSGLSEYGFVLFEEPTVEQRLLLVDKSLESLQAYYKQVGGDLFWTSGAMAHLRRLAKNSRNFALTETSIQSAVTQVCVGGGL